MNNKHEIIYTNKTIGNIYFEKYYLFFNYNFKIINYLILIDAKYFYNIILYCMKILLSIKRKSFVWKVNFYKDITILYI